MLAQTKTQRNPDFYAPTWLKEQPVWLLYKLKHNGATKPRKIPYYANGQPRKGDLDTPEDRDQLVAFDEAWNVLQNDPRGFSGVAIALGPLDDGTYLQGVDLDAIEENPELAAIQPPRGAWAEPSPSGKGLHIVGKGKVFNAMGSNGTGVEAYATGRFFTVTGKGSGNGRRCLSTLIKKKLLPIHGGDWEKTQRESNTLTFETKEQAEEVLDDLANALEYIPNNNDRHRWIKVGMIFRFTGLAAEDVGVSDASERCYDMWDEWSQFVDNYDPNDQMDKWQTFKPQGRVTPATLFQWAQDAGWDNPRAGSTLPIEKVFDKLPEEEPAPELPPKTEEELQQIDALIERLPAVQRAVAHQLQKVTKYPLKTLSLFGSFAVVQILGNRHFYLADDDPVFLNMNYAFIANAGAGKNAIIKVLTHYCDELGIYYSNNFASMAGLEEALLANDGLVIGLLDEYNPVQHMQNEVTLLNNALFDRVGTLHWQRGIKETAKDRKKVHHPFNVMVSCSTHSTQFGQDPQAAYLQASGGKLRRTMFVLCNEKRVRNRQSSAAWIHKDVKTWHDSLVKQWRKQLPTDLSFDDDDDYTQEIKSRPHIGVGMTAEADEYNERKIAWYDAQMNRGMLDETVETMYAGVGYLAIKMALTLRICKTKRLRNTDISIGIEEMQLAWDIVEFYVKTMAKPLSESISMNRVSGDSRRILDKIKHIVEEKEYYLTNVKKYDRPLYKKYLKEKNMVSAAYVRMVLAGKVYNYSLAEEELVHSDQVRLVKVENKDVGKRKSEQGAKFYKLVV